MNYQRISGAIVLTNKLPNGDLQFVINNHEIGDINFMIINNPIGGSQMIAFVLSSINKVVTVKYSGIKPRIAKYVY